MQGLEVRLDTLCMGNIRELYENIVELAESLEKTGQQVPIVVGKLVEGKRQLFDGHRRVQAALLKGWPTLKAVESDRVPTKEELVLWQLVNDVQREHLTNHERSMAAIAVKNANPKMTVKQLDGLINIGESLLWKILQAEKLHPPALEAYRDGRLGLVAMVEVAKHTDTEVQEVQLNLLLGGTSVQDVRKARKKPDSTPSAVRASRIKIELGNELIVTIAGADLTLDEAIEAVVSAQKEMRKGRDLGLDAKTIVSVARDKARNGG
jgi:ParB family transcriptional regulator, chromosome partitioning protein